MIAFRPTVLAGTLVVLCCTIGTTGHTQRAPTIPRDIVVTYRPSGGPTCGNNILMEEIAQALRARLRAYGVVHPEVQTQDTDSVVVRVPGSLRYTHEIAAQLRLPGTLSILLPANLRTDLTPNAPFELVRKRGEKPYVVDAGGKRVQLSRVTSQAKVLFDQSMLAEGSEAEVGGPGGPRVRVAVAPRHWQELRKELVRCKFRVVLVMVDGELWWAPFLAMDEAPTQLYVYGGSPFASRALAIRLNDPLPCALSIANTQHVDPAAADRP